MTQYNTLNIKLSNSQLNKLKESIKNCTQVTLNLSSNVIGNSNDETNFPSKLLLLCNTQVLRVCKAFSNKRNKKIKLSETLLHKIGPSWRFKVMLLGPLQKTGLLLLKNVFKTLAESF